MLMILGKSMSNNTELTENPKKSRKINNYMKKLFLLSVLIFSLNHILTAQVSIQGKVTDASGSPLPGANILIKGTKFSTITRSDGTYELKDVPVGSTLIVHFIGFTSREMKIEKEKTVYDLTLDYDEAKLTEVVVLGYEAGSSDSEWNGASLFYNLDGSDADNIIGAAKVQINTAVIIPDLLKLHVISNITKPTGNLDTASIRKDIRKLAQSSQGLSFGLEPIFNLLNKPNVKVRSWVSVNYKLNSFTKKLDNRTEETNNLSQARFTIGAELYALKFSNSEKSIHIGVEGFLNKFKEQDYKAIFGESKRNLTGAEFTVIIPLFAKLGFILNQTFVRGSKPVIGAGIVVGK